MVEITEEMIKVGFAAGYELDHIFEYQVEYILKAVAPLIEAQVIERCIDAEPDHQVNKALDIYENIAEFAIRWTIAMDDMMEGNNRTAQAYREWRTKQIEAQVIERCAKVAEERSVSGDYDDYWGIPAEVAGAIRALIAHPRAASENTCEDPS